MSGAVKNQTLLEQPVLDKNDIVKVVEEETYLPADPEQAAKFRYQMPTRVPYPGPIGFMRRHIFKTYVVLVAVVTVLWLGVDFWNMVVLGADFRKWWEFAKIFSVPLICLVFTWFHVWLALMMMFYPINFIGCCKPYIGWQGIVPRKAATMAERACNKMIGNIVTIEEFVDRIDAERFYSELQGSIATIAAETLERIVMKRWPTMWAALPKSVQEEIKEKVLADVKKGVLPAMDDVKKNVNTVLDIRQMSIDMLVKDKTMMVNMFLDIAPRELQFIQHVAAVMGFLLGCVQAALYVVLPQGGNLDYYLLPGSGLLIGFATNWLALKMTFSPIWPHMFCGNTLNWQGVFLKRQAIAAEKMSALICSNIMDARNMFAYMAENNPEGVDRLLAIYQTHMSKTLDDTLGFARTVVPTFVGQGIDDIKTDVVEISLELVPEHMAEIEVFLNKSMKISETLAWRLQRLDPPEFEDIIHPIFAEDEWILLLVGGILGVAIGLVQAWAMANL